MQQAPIFTLNCDNFYWSNFFAPDTPLLREKGRYKIYFVLTIFSLKINHSGGGGQGGEVQGANPLSYAVNP